MTGKPYAESMPAILVRLMSLVLKVHSWGYHRWLPGEGRTPEEYCKSEARSEMLAPKCGTVPK